MRIAFITGGLGRGKDGVGDYTWLLAEECERLGHSFCALAFNDPFVSSESGILEADGKCLRLGRTQSWASRLVEAREFLRAFAPDFVSVQFVCYGFHPKGLAWRAGPWLRDVIGAVPVQMMFHELWVGPHNDASIKDRIYGALQKPLVLRAIRMLTPTVIHTSNPIYQKCLQRAGVSASVLPIFGSVPVPAAPRQDWLIKRLQDSGVEISENVRGDFWIFGMYGQLHPIWPPEPLLGLIAAAAKAHSKKAVIVAAGRIGSGQALWERIGRDYKNELGFCRLGEMSTEELGDFLQFIDFGIATTPWAIIGKSSTVKSMEDHGVPILVNRDDVSFPFERKESEKSPLLHKAHESLPAAFPHLERRMGKWSLGDVARDFLSAMGRAVAGLKKEGI